MVRSQTGVLITVSVFSGLLGGIVATCLVGGGLVTAQEPAGEVPAVVSAKEFRLLDRQGPQPRSPLTTKSSRSSPCAMSLILRGCGSGSPGTPE